MQPLWTDLRHAARGLRKRHAFAAAVVVTLGLGIGTATAIFSFAYGVLLRPFDYPEPEQIVRVFTVSSKEGGRESGSALLDVDDWRRSSRTLDGIGGFTDFDTDLRSADSPAQPVRICQLNAGALRAVGVPPVLGRLFTEEEDRPGGDVHKALLSHGLWRTRFGGDPGVLGRRIETAIGAFTVVGVMPPGFGFPGRVDVWTPMESWYAIQVGERREKKRLQRYYPVVARVRGGRTIAEAEAELNTIAAALERQYPGENEGIHVRLRPLRDAVTGDVRPHVRLVSAAAALLLVICWFNVAGLLLSRAIGQRREFALRAALGASRARLLAASFAESAVLAAGGGLLGAALAVGLVAALLRLIPVPLPTWMRIEVDLPSLAFALGVSALTVFVGGLAAALLVSRPDLAGMLRDDTRTTTGGGARLRRALVVSEVALTLLLLVGAGLLARTFLHLRGQGTGFRQEGLLVARATNYRPGTRVEQATALSQFHEHVLARLRGLPGVVSAGGSSNMPYTRTTPDRSRARLRLRGEGEEERRVQLPVSGADVSPGFLETMGIPLVQGRRIDASDTPQSAMVVLVSERAARTLWPGRDPIGREIYWGNDEPSAQNPYCRVAGVVGNVRYLAGEPDDGLELYYPYTQYPITNIYYVLRTHGDPAAFAGVVRQAILEVDRNAAIVFVKTVETMIDDSLWQRRLWSVLLAAFGALSLVLVAVGIYGLLSYLVAQRTREIGVRMALGAGRRDILALVLGDGARLLGAGIALGLAASLALRRVVASLVFGVSPTDALSVLAASVLLAAVALLACGLPARRASAVDPIRALRAE